MKYVTYSSGQLDFCNWLADGHDGILWLALPSVKSINVDFFNQIWYLSVR